MRQTQFFKLKPCPLLPAAQSEKPLGIDSSLCSIFTGCDISSRGDCKYGGDFIRPYKHGLILTGSDVLFKTIKAVTRDQRSSGRRSKFTLKRTRSPLEPGFPARPSVDKVI